MHLIPHLWTQTYQNNNLLLITLITVRIKHITDSNLKLSCCVPHRLVTSDCVWSSAAPAVDADTRPVNEWRQIREAIVTTPQQLQKYTSFNHTLGTAVVFSIPKHSFSVSRSSWFKSLYTGAVKTTRHTFFHRTKFHKINECFFSSCCLLVSSTGFVLFQTDQVPAILWHSRYAMDVWHFKSVALDKLISRYVKT